MNNRTRRVAASIVVSAAFVFAAATAQADSGTWTGLGVNAIWTNNVNWTGATYPSGTQTATFNNNGNGNTSLSQNYSSHSITYVAFKTIDCAPYILGTSSSQRLWLRNNGSVTVDSAVTNNQTVKAYVQLGNVFTNASTIVFKNDSATARLSFNAHVNFSSVTSNQQPNILDIQGVGAVSLLGNIYATNQVFFTLYNKGSGLLTVSGSNNIQRLYMASALTSRIDIANGYLNITNGSASYSLYCNGDGVINGTGSIRLGTGTDENFARCYVAAGKTLTVNPKILSEGGLDLYSGTGTLVLNGINDFASNIVLSAGGAISVAKIGNRGSTDSNLGRGQLIRFNGSSAQLTYTGTGETTDRILEVNNNAILDHSGAGTLLFTADLSVGGTVKTFKLQGSTEGIGEIAGSIGPGAATTSLGKDGSGEWRLTGANTYAGLTTVSGGTLVLAGANGSAAATTNITLKQGATLRLEKSADVNPADRINDAAAVVLDGGTLAFSHSAGAADYSESVGALVVGGNASTVSASQAAEERTSTLTFDSLGRSGLGTVNFEGVGLGESTRNRILFSTPPTLVNGMIGEWATVNGTELATYDATLGVMAIPASSITNIAAYGPDSVIPNSTALHARITEEGTAGDITLEGDPTSSILTLTQRTAFPAVVATAGKQFKVGLVQIDSDKAGLKLGAAVGDGTVTGPDAGSGLTLSNDSTNGVLTVNAAASDNAGADSLTKRGVGSVTMNGLLGLSGPMYLTGGTLTLAQVPDQTHQLGNTLLMTGGGETVTTLNIDGKAQVLNYGSLTNGVMAGDRCRINVLSDLTIQGIGNANTSGQLYVGGGLGSAGAVIQKAGNVTVSSGQGSGDYLGLGRMGGYGYYRISGGTVTAGEISVGGSTHGFGTNVGVLDLYDGTLTSDRSYLLLAWARGYGVMNLFGGSYAAGASTGGQIAMTYGRTLGTFAMVNLLGPTARMYESGVDSQKIIIMAFTNGNLSTVFNLNSGTLYCNRVYARNANTPSYFNFNGGTLRAVVDQSSWLLDLTAATVYPGGAVMDTAGFDVTVNQPLLAPAGYGVTGVDLASGGAGYIGAPAVQITGGNGVNATAIALVDLEESSPTCGQVTNILVTSAGFGYGVSDTLTVTLYGGGCLTAATAGAVTKGANSSGGLTKLGEGALTLGGACTYSAPTIVSNGTLRLGVANALPPNAAVILDGGTYDLNSFTVTNTVSGSGGTIASGTLYSEFSPAGTNAVSSQALTLSAATLAGIYRADVATDGTCDLLAVQGDLDLSGLSLQIVDLDRLNRSQTYTLATATGSLSGEFAATNLPDSHWHVRAGASGSVMLYFSDGLVITVR